MNDMGHIVHHVGLNELMDVLISRLTAAVQAFDPEQTSIPVRSGFHYEQPHTGLVEWMPLLNRGDQVMIKVVGYHPANPQAYGLPTIVSTISTYDTTTGHLSGLMDGVLLTALRTGATSALASKFLAHPESAALGLIGCGAQAVTQLHALSRIFRLEKVLIHDTDPRALLSFADRCAALDLAVDFIPAPIQDILVDSDILCTATSVAVGAGPLFSHLDTNPRLHINAVGSDFPGKVELPRDLLEMSLVCPDFRAQAVVEGECQQLKPENIGPDIIEVVQNPEKYAYAQHQRSVFDSTGWALEDLVAMELFLEYATELGLGQEIEIEKMQEDAKNPYHFLREAVVKV
jgi:L-lysine cyclodeaminase